MKGAKLFICDRFWQAPRKLHERLRAAHSVFKLDLQLGDYERQVREAIAGCDALIAIIGPNWLDEMGRFQLATAFARSIPVIPVLLEETPLPEKSQLSENIQKLSSQMGVRIRSSSFDRDVETLENFITILIDQRNFNFSRQSFEERPLRAFDIFLCHNSQDKQFVKEIAEQLITRGFRPWLDEWELQPGRRWQKTLENEIDNIRTAAIFVGESGFGPWQNLLKSAEFSFVFLMPLPFGDGRRPIAL
jgi:hypothetical protein